MSPDLNITFAALADPTRRAILARLIAGEASVTELAEPFEMSLPAVSKHLKVLERAGLIVRGREAQRGPCRLQAGPLKDVADWTEQYRRFFEQSFDRLDDHLRGLKKKQTEKVKTHGRKRNQSCWRCFSPGDCNYSRFRRATRARFRSDDRSETGSAVVGAKRLYYYDSRDGCEAGRCLAAHHARARWDGLSQQNRLYRGGETRAH